VLPALLGLVTALSVVPATPSPNSYSFVRSATVIAPNDDGSGRHLNAPKFRIAGTGQSFAGVGVFRTAGGSSLALVSYVEGEKPPWIVSATIGGKAAPLMPERGETKDCDANEMPRCIYATVVSFELDGKVLGPGIVNGLSYRLTDLSGRSYAFEVPAPYLKALFDAWLTIGDPPNSSARGPRR
jgi:hypothetical protein